MGTKLVIEGIGNGSLFRYGRIFGVHNPFGSDIGKAKDPFINLNTLARLSYHENHAIKDIVVKNLRKRFYLDLGLDLKKLSLFNRQVLIKALIDIETYSAGYPYHLPRALADHLDNLIPHFIPEELSQLAKTQNGQIAKMVAKNACPRTALLEILYSRKIQYSSPELTRELFEKLESELSPEELGQVASTLTPHNSNLRDIRLKLANNPRVPKNVLIGFVISHEDGVATDALMTIESSKKSLTPEELDYILQELDRFMHNPLSRKIRNEISQMPHLSRATLLKIAKTDIGAYTKLEEGLTTEEIDQLAREIPSVNYTNEIIEKISQHLRTSKQTLKFLFLYHNLYHNNKRAYDRIKPDLSVADFEELAKYGAYTEEVTQHPNAPTTLIARVISQQILKSKKVVDKPAEGYHTPVIYHETSGHAPDIGGEWIETSAEISHYEYSEKDIQNVLALIRAHILIKQQEILDELKKINPELWAKIKEDI